MIKKFTVLAISLRLGQFTIAELSKAAGVPEATVRTVIQRSPETWFQVTVVPSGVKGGQPHRYELTEAGKTGIGASLERLPSLDRLAPTPPQGSIPLGLVSARDALLQIPKLGEALAERVREDALSSLDWAESEIDGEGFPGDVKLLRGQLREIRAKLQSLPRREPVHAKQDSTANIRPWQVALGYPIPTAYPGSHQSAAVTHFSQGSVSAQTVAAPAPARALQVFISYFETDLSAGEMATFAKVALSGAGREHEELDLVIKRVEAHELLDCVRARGDASRGAEGLRILLCAADETDSRDVHQVLEQVRSLNRVGAQVLDYGYNVKVADVTKTLHVGYQPYAAKPQQMQWVEEIIQTG
jgi:hypothetical protein